MMQKREKEILYLRASSLCENYKVNRWHGERENKKNYIEWSNRYAYAFNEIFGILEYLGLDKDFVRWAERNEFEYETSYIDWNKAREDAFPA